MAQPLTTPSNRPTGATIPGASAEAGITRTIATPGATAGETKGLSRRALTPMVALAAMTAAALADAPSPTRLSESQLDTITAGLNIDTQNFAIQTGCSSCEVFHYGATLIPGFWTQGSAESNDAKSNGWAVGYNGPLAMLGGGAGSGSGSSGGAGGVYPPIGEEGKGRALGSGFVDGGTGGGFGYRGPLTAFQLGVGASVGKDAYSAAAAGAGKPLSLNDVGGTISVPTGGGKSASLTVMTGFSAPGS